MQTVVKVKENCALEIRYECITVRILLVVAVLFLVYCSLYVMAK